MNRLTENNIYTQEIHDELVRVIEEEKEYIKKLPEEGIASYDILLTQTKRQQSVYTFSKTKKNILWDDGKSN